MFNISIMNKNIEYYRQADQFFDLFKFNNAVEVSQCLVAQKMPAHQRNIDECYIVNSDVALRAMLSQFTHFPLYLKKRSSVYDLIVHLKNHINEYLKLYTFLADDCSKKTLIDFFCSQLFSDETILSETNAPLLLIGSNAPCRKIQAIDELLPEFEKIHQILHYGKVYLRMLYLANGSIVIRIFPDLPEKIIIESAEQAVNEYTNDILGLTQIAQMLEEALSLIQELASEGNLNDAFPLLAMCDKSLHSMSQVIECHYPHTVK